MIRRWIIFIASINLPWVPLYHSYRSFGGQMCKRTWRYHKLPHFSIKKYSFINLNLLKKTWAPAIRRTKETNRFHDSSCLHGQMKPWWNRPRQDPTGATSTRPWRLILGELGRAWAAAPWWPVVASLGDLRKLLSNCGNLQGRHGGTWSRPYLFLGVSRLVRLPTVFWSWWWSSCGVRLLAMTIQGLWQLWRLYIDGNGMAPWWYCIILQ